MALVKMYGRYDTQPCETITGMQTKKKVFRCAHGAGFVILPLRQQTHQQILVSEVPRRADKDFYANLRSHTSSSPGDELFKRVKN